MSHPGHENSDRRRLRSLIMFSAYCNLLQHTLAYHVHKRIMSPAEVGPVEKVVVSEGFAQISFGAAKHAFAAVQKCDGSVLDRC